VNTILPFIIVGLTAGSVYALAAVGLVLTYKTSRIFNFGYGAIATVGAYVFYALHIQHGVNWPLSVVIAVFGVGAVLGLLFEPFARALTRASLALQVAGTVGILLFVQAFFSVIYGQNTRTFPQFLPSGTAFTIDRVEVSVDQLITVGLGLGLTIALVVFFRRARLGVAMRGVVDNSELLDLAGTGPARVRRAAWIIGCTFAALSGVLLAPSLNLDPLGLTLLVVQAFGAAAIGAFTSLPVTYLGGLLIGVLASVLTKYVVSSSVILAGIPSSLPFIVLFVAMLAMPRRWLIAPARIVPERSSWTGPWRIQAVAGVALVAFLAFIPGIVGFRLVEWTVFLTYVIVFLSLGLLVKVSGLISLCQLSFAAVGAAALPHLVNAGVPWLIALIVAGLIAVPLGALLAIPAIRLGGLYLALATFGFGILLQQMFYSSSLMFGYAGIAEPRPHLSFAAVDTDKGFYFVVLIIVVLVTLGVIGINRSRLGRLLRAMADSPLALATNGTSVNTTRVFVFAISAFLASIAGALYGVANTFMTGATFTPLASLELVALIVIVAGNAPWYAVAASAGLVLIPAYITNGNVTYYLQMLFGVSAVAVAIAGLPALSPRIRAAIDRIGGRKPPSAPKHALVPAAAQRPPLAKLQLVVSNLRVQFGGLVAVEDFTFSAPSGRITGLIGPNGAGKTTTFNACSGLARASRGEIVLGERDVTHYPAARRARMGLGRTFQQMRLFDSLTVAENVAIGREASLAGASPLTQLVSSRSDSVAVRHRSAEALDLCGITELANIPAGSLSTGQRRLVELARCLAGPYSVLLLDEPSAGLDQSETRRFGEILTRIVEERGVGILLVEHDMALVMKVSAHIYVLDFGKQLFEGTPSEVTQSPIVQAAYLGSEAQAQTPAAQDDPTEPSERPNRPTE